MQAVKTLYLVRINILEHLRNLTQPTGARRAREHTLKLGFFGEISTLRLGSRSGLRSRDPSIFNILEVVLTKFSSSGSFIRGVC